MCGIIGYVGSKNTESVLLSGLKRLEYRGYDSAGVADRTNEAELSVRRSVGKIENLEAILKEKPAAGHAGIGHTRWATHGEPSILNAHPHTSSSEGIAVVHNGIIENYADLKKELEEKGREFRSETDSEVIAYLIEEIKENQGISLEKAVKLALKRLVGAYALLVISKEEKGKIIAAKLGSPLIIGIGEGGEKFIASDASALVEYTRNVIYMKDREIAVIEPEIPVSLKTLEEEARLPETEKLEFSLEELEKKGFAHFMLKEIHEQVETVRDSMRGRVDPDKSTVRLGGILDYEKKIANAQRVHFISCGTSWHAGIIGEYLFGEFARIPARAEYASEFRYKNPVLDEKDVVIAISQSGETADTLGAVELAKKKGATVLGVTNVVGSTLARETHAGSYTHAGVEIGVASTKAFTAQVVVLTIMALRIGWLKGNIPEMELQKLISELSLMPDKIEAILSDQEEIQKIAEKYHKASNALFLGRGYGFPIALEGALKLKEISYIHAEGYPAGEMKHGPIALLEEGVPVFAVATKNKTFEKMNSNLLEVKARKGSLILIATKGDDRLNKTANDIIKIPETHDAFSPLLSVVPFQLLAYYTAVARGADVDKPRNLAKSVTVE